MTRCMECDAPIPMGLLCPTCIHLPWSEKVQRELVARVSAKLNTPSRFLRVPTNA